MSIQVCPHCYCKIIPTADGSCPACGRNTRDLRETDPHKALLGINASDALPPVCHHCGTPTRNTKKLAVASEPQDTTFSPGIASLLIRCIKPFGFLAAMERDRKSNRLTLRLPTCEQCARQLKEILPHYIDFEARRFDLVVHTEFKRAMQGTR